MKVRQKDILERDVIIEIMRKQILGLLKELSETRKLLRKVIKE